ncbi:hypothetical protein Sjap_010708 [Stephania japonica]|uniref:Uncharacterized protein n=1 Tax=Stephania japonica TaxID=461633 RepID=A0AAP0J9X8_9MAGN
MTTLRDPQKKNFQDVDLRVECQPRRQVTFGSAIFRFFKENNIQVGDVCVFELDPTAKKKGRIVFDVKVLNGQTRNDSPNVMGTHEKMKYVGGGASYFTPPTSLNLQMEQLKSLEDRLKSLEDDVKEMKVVMRSLCTTLKQEMENLVRTSCETLKEDFTKTIESWEGRFSEHGADIKKAIGQVEMHLSHRNSGMAKHEGLSDDVLTTVGATVKGNGN